jgi:hypothetical protein
VFLRWISHPIAPGRGPRSALHQARFPYDVCPHRPAAAPLRLQPVIEGLAPGRPRRAVSWAPLSGILDCCARDPDWPLGRVAFWREMRAHLALLPAFPGGAAILTGWPALESSLAAVVPLPDPLDLRLADRWASAPRSWEGDWYEQQRRTLAALRARLTAEDARAQAAEASRDTAQAAERAAAQAASRQRAAEEAAAQARQEAERARQEAERGTAERREQAERGAAERREQAEKLRGASATHRARLGEAVSLLGIALPFTEKELKTAFRSAVRRHHPDRGGSGERMIQILAAHRLLVAFLG